MVFGSPTATQLRPTPLTMPSHALACSAVETVVPPRGKALISTDLSISFPSGYYARVAPRSGLAWKNSIDVGAGVIGDAWVLSDCRPPCSRCFKLQLLPFAIG